MFTLRPSRSLLLMLFFAASGAMAVSLADLSNQDAGNGLKAALEKGSIAAVAKLGVENGFLKNDKVRIPLPGMLEQARPLLKMTGKGLRAAVFIVTDSIQSIVPTRGDRP